VLPSSPERRARGAEVFAAAHPAGPWVWKDPRLCLLAPWWRETLGASPVAVLTVRDPLESARSLLARNNVDLEWGLALWERYLRSALSVLDGVPTLVWRYADLLADPRGTAGQARAFLTEHGLPLLDGGEDAIEAFLDPRLRHQREAVDAPLRPLSPEQDHLSRLVDGLAGAYPSFEPPDLPPETPRLAELLAWHRGRFHEIHRPIRLQKAQVSATPQSAQEKPVTTSHQLPHGWQRWLARNTLAGLPDADLQQTLVSGAGVTAEVAQAASAELHSDPVLEAAEELLQRARKATSYLDIRQQLADLVPSSAEPERRRGVGRGEFLTEYYATNTPVVLTDLTEHWDARHRWSLDYFTQVLGDETVEVMTGRTDDPRYEQNSEQHKTSMRFADYLAHVGRKDPSNEMYLVANNHLLELPAAKPLWEDFDSPAAYLDARDETGRVFFWLGPAGTVTPLHHDVMNVLLTQVCGRKRVILVSPTRTHCVYNDLSVYSKVNAADPDLERHPAFRDAHPVEVILNPGDALFIPVGWWHYVEALDQSTSVSFTNFRWSNDFEWFHPHGR
jgi:hypothetical protein